MLLFLLRHANKIHVCGHLFNTTIIIIIAVNIFLLYLLRSFFTVRRMSIACIYVEYLHVTGNSLFPPCDTFVHEHVLMCLSDKFFFTFVLFR